MSVYENDLSRMGYSEIEDLQKLLAAYLKDKIMLRDDCIKGFGFNANSGYVWLQTEDYNCYMINPNSGLLEEFITTPHSGHKGFYDDLVDDALGYDSNWEKDDIEYLLELHTCESHIFVLSEEQEEELTEKLK